MHRAFEPLEQVHGHQRLDALFASGRLEVPMPDVLPGRKALRTSTAGSAAHSSAAHTASVSIPTA